MRTTSYYASNPRNPAKPLLGLSMMMWALMSAVLLLGDLWGALEPTVWAATFTVTNTNNSGSGSLRQAIIDANNTPGLDMITFNIPPGGPVST